MRTDILTAWEGFWKEKQLPDETFIAPGYIGAEVIAEFCEEFVAALEAQLAEANELLVGAQQNEHDAVEAAKRAEAELKSVVNERNLCNELLRKAEAELDALREELECAEWYITCRDVLWVYPEMRTYPEMQTILLRARLSWMEARSALAQGESKPVPCQHEWEYLGDGVNRCTKCGGISCDAAVQPQAGEGE